LLGGLESLVESPKLKTKCGSRKYPYPYHGVKWKSWRGGCLKAPEIVEGRGLDG